MGSGTSKYNLKLFGISTGVAMAVGGALDMTIIYSTYFLSLFKLAVPHIITIERPGGVLIIYLYT